MSFVGELNEASKELSDSERVRERSICDPNEPSYFCARCRLACEPEREASAKSSSFAAATQSPIAPYDDCRSTVDTAPARVAAYFSKDANAWRHAVAATAGRGSAILPEADERIALNSRDTPSTSNLAVVEPSESAAQKPAMALAQSNIVPALSGGDDSTSINAHNDDTPPHSQNAVAARESRAFDKITANRVKSATVSSLSASTSTNRSANHRATAAPSTLARSSPPLSVSAAAAGPLARATVNAASATVSRRIAPSRPPRRRAYLSTTSSHVATHRAIASSSSRFARVASARCRLSAA
mmetsp:Transcript_4737/g.18136  ORF Transcript_4737/g.18136 Transcript_4737/m.18136 type:complete len:300 (-) Transcript_4737:292-1191(-)